MTMQRIEMDSKLKTGFGEAGADQRSCEHCAGVPGPGLGDRGRPVGHGDEPLGRAENMDDETVGGPISATDGDRRTTQCSTRSAVTTRPRSRSSNNGQIKTKVKLDFETKDDLHGGADGVRPLGRERTRILVTDHGHRRARQSGHNRRPPLSTTLRTDTDAVATFSAMDQDGDAIVWSLGGD